MSYNKVKLTVVSSMFDISKRTDYWLEHEVAKPISEYVADKNIVSMRDVDVKYSINGRVLDDSELIAVCPNINDHIVVVPVPRGGGGEGEGDKNWGRTIAMVVLMVVLMVVAPYLTAPAALGAGWGAVAIMAIGMMGSFAINALFPNAPPSYPALPGIGGASGIGAGSMEAQTDTYGWGDMRNMTTQGHPLPRIYGTRRVGGTIINRYIDTVGDDQYYNVLLALHDGCIQGVANIKINDEAIENFDNVWQRIKLGVRNQEPVEYFGDTYNYKSYSREITTDAYVTATVEGDATEGLRIDIVCPNGLYYVNGQGGLDSTNIEMSIEYRMVGDAAWTSIVAGEGGKETYSDFVYTAQGFKFTSQCQSVKFQYASQYGLPNCPSCPKIKPGWWSFPIRTPYMQVDLEPVWNPALTATIQYRVGSGYPDQSGGWQDFGTYDTMGVWVEITGLNRQVVEVRNKMDSGAFLADVEEWFSSITRTVNTGGALGAINIIGARRGPLRRSFDVRDLSAGSYEVRLKKLAVAGTGGRYENTLYLGGIAQIIPDDFAYPYTALLGVRALATNQLAGAVPNVTCEVIRNIVPIYNPTTGVWEPKPADNPAWACYDMLVRPYYTLDISYDGSVYNLQVKGYDGVAPARMDYTAFSEWADWCNVKINGVPRAIINIVFDSQMSMWDALVHVAQVGRGIVIMRGTKFSCVVDKSGDPVQMFNVSNIVRDSFKETFLALEDRANIFEVTYFDKARDFQREIIQVYGNDWVEGGVEKKASLVLYGCTSYQQAYREAVYRLNLNKYLVRSIEFGVDVDAIACQLGDVIRVQHDLPQWGYGGRVLDSTNNTVTIDQQLTLDGSSTYIVYIRHADDTVENRTVTTSSATTNKLTVSSNWTSNPAENDLFTFGVQNSEFKLFKVIGISRSQDLKRTISAVEYNASLYTESLPTTWNSSALQAIPIATNVHINEVLKSEVAGVYSSEVHMTWDYVVYDERKLAKWDIYRKDSSVTDSVWEFLGATKNLGYISTHAWQYQHAYQIAICGSDILADRGHSPDSNNVIKSVITILWKYAPPANVTGFIGVQDGMSLIMRWDHVADVDRRGYEIREGPTWMSGVVIVKEVSANTYTHKLTYDGTFKWHIKAIDNSGNKSSTGSTITVVVSGIADIINIVYEKEELDDFVNGVASSVTGDLSASNVTNNLVWVHSGNTPGLHVPHTLLDVGSGVSKWVDSGTSLTEYTGTTKTEGYYISPTRDLTKSITGTLRLFKDYESEILRFTDRTYPSRTDQTYPADTDTEITDESSHQTFYRVSGSSPLTALSWTTYQASPVQASFRYFQRKDRFNLDSNFTALAFTSIYTWIDVPETNYTFNSQLVGASGSTFDLSTDFSLNFLVNYLVSPSVVSDPYYVMIKNKTLTDFYITLYDDAGAKQSGQIDLFIKGY